MKDEPSEFALTLMKRLTDGEDFMLCERELVVLSEYEVNTLNRTARKLGYTVELDCTRMTRSYSL